MEARVHVRASYVKLRPLAIHTNEQVRLPEAEAHNLNIQRREECKTDTFSSFGYIVGVTALEDFLRGREPKSDTEPSWRWQRILRR